MSRKRLTRLLSSLRPGDASRRGLPETLTSAAAQGDLASLEAFLDRGADLGERTPGFASPLVAACTAGRLEAVRLLLARGADLRPKEAVVTPVQAAVMNGHVEMVKALSKRGPPWTRPRPACPGPAPPASSRWWSSWFVRPRPRPARAEGRSLRERAMDAARMAGRRAIVSYLRDQTVDPEEVRSPTALDERRALQARLQKDRGEAPLASAEERPQRIQEAIEALRSAGKAPPPGPPTTGSRSSPWPPATGCTRSWRPCWPRGRPRRGGRALARDPAHPGRRGRPPRDRAPAPRPRRQPGGPGLPKAAPRSPPPPNTAIPSW